MGSSLLTSGTSFEDLTGLISNYGANAFAGSNTSTIKIGNGLTLGSDAFNAAQNSIIEIGNFITTGTHTLGANSLNSTWRFRGTIGIDATMNSQLSFDLIGQTIETIVANQTSHPLGGVEGDLADLIFSGATVSFTL